MVTSVSNSSQNPPTSASNATASMTSDYTTFLNLLTAQIKNQDPLSPMDTTEWTNQLVQYSNLEQGIQSNSYLKTIASNSGNSMASAVSYIGKTVTTNDATATLSNGSANWTYNLPSDASGVTYKITDSNGNVVYSSSQTNLSAGSHTFNWDGKASSGLSETPGNYTLSVTALDATGNAMTATAGVSGVVTSASTAADGTVNLSINGSTVPLSSVNSVS